MTIESNHGWTDVPFAAHGSVGTCSRCKRPGYELNDEGWCAHCWSPDELQDVMIELAGNISLGAITREQAEEELVARVGRDMTTAEYHEWCDNIAEAMRIVAEAGRG